MKPHKHAELIKAWADGAEIQIFDPESQAWVDDDLPIIWHDDMRYRIKPEEKKLVVRWLWTNDCGDMTRNLYSEDEIKGISSCNVKLEWSRTEFPK